MRDLHRCVKKTKCTFVLKRHEKKYFFVKKINVAKLKRMRILQFVNRTNERRVRVSKKSKETRIFLLSERLDSVRRSSSSPL